MCPVYAWTYSPAGGAAQKPKFMMINKKARATQTQIGIPPKVWRFGLGGAGLGNSVWHFQQTFLSSGFQVLHSGQFILGD